MKTLRVDLWFDIEIEDPEEAEFLCDEDDYSCPDREEAVWQYLTNWVNGNDKAYPGRPRSAVRYQNMSTDEVND